MEEDVKAVEEAVEVAKAKPGKAKYTDGAYMAMSKEEKRKERIRRRKEAKGEKTVAAD